MDDLGKKDRFLNKLKSSIVNVLPKDYQNIPLSDIDTRALNPNIKALFNRYADYAIKARGLKNSSTIKIAEDAAASMHMAKNAMDIVLPLLERGKNFNALPTAIRQSFSSYFGLSDDEAKRMFADKQIQSFLNKYRHTLYGSAVSKHEEENFLKSATNLFKSNQDIAIAIVSSLENKLGALEGAKETLGNEIFNAKYGDLYRNIKDNIELYKKALNLASNLPKDEELITIAPKQEQPKPVAKKVLEDGTILIKYSDGSIRRYGK